MGIFATFFLFLITILSLFVTTTSFISQVDSSARIFQFLFLPITLYLVVCTIANIFKKKNLIEINSNWKRIFIYYSFVISTSLVVISFLASRTIPEFISSLIFSPIAFYFLILVFPMPNPEARATSIIQNTKKLVTPAQINSLTSKLVDVDRRDFLKLIGTAGITAFVFSLFSRKSNVPFFGEVSNVDSGYIKDSIGTKIDPAEKSPTDGYNVSEIDDSSEISYFGFINKLGQWFIMRQDVDKAFRYSKGDKDFSKNWEKRDELDYDYFNNVF